MRRFIDMLQHINNFFGRRFVGVFGQFRSLKSVLANGESNPGPVTTRHSLVFLKSKQDREQGVRRMLLTTKLHVLRVDRDAYVGRSAKFIAEFFGIGPDACQRRREWSSKGAGRRLR